MDTSTETVPYQALMWRFTRKAVRASRKDGRLRFIYLSGVSLRRDATIDTLWTNGEVIGTWKAGKASGDIAGGVGAMA